LPEENDKNKEGKLKITCEHEREKDWARAKHWNIGNIEDDAALCQQMISRFIKTFLSLLWAFKTCGWKKLTVSWNVTGEKGGNKCFEKNTHVKWKRIKFKNNLLFSAITAWYKEKRK
jgi:hypothetical protein